MASLGGASSFIGRSSFLTGGGGTSPLGTGAANDAVLQQRLRLRQKQLATQRRQISGRVSHGAGGAEIMMRGAVPERAVGAEGPASPSQSDRKSEPAPADPALRAALPGPPSVLVKGTAGGKAGLTATRRGAAAASEESKGSASGARFRSASLPQVPGGGGGAEPPRFGSVAVTHMVRSSTVSLLPDGGSQGAECKPDNGASGGARASCWRRLRKRTMLHPNRPFRLGWDVGIFVMLVYVAVWMPFRLAFFDNVRRAVVLAPPALHPRATHTRPAEAVLTPDLPRARPQDEPKWSERTNEFITGCFIIDVLLNFRTGYIVSETGAVVMNEALVAKYCACRGRSWAAAWAGPIIAPNHPTCLPPPHTTPTAQTYARGLRWISSRACPST